MAYNSTITQKKCKCSPDCDKWPTTSFSGYYYAHAPQEIKDKQGLKAKRGYQNARNKASLSKLSRDVKSIAAENGALKSPNNAKLALQAFFFEARKQMTGVCVCGCQGKSSRDSDQYFKYSIGHVLSKAKFPSIATHPENWVELAFWGGCHTVFDDKGYSYCKETKPILWEIVVRKFKILFPFIAENEIKFIPDVLMMELDNERVAPQNKSLS